MCLVAPLIVYSLLSLSSTLAPTLAPTKVDMETCIDQKTRAEAEAKASVLTLDELDEVIREQDREIAWLHQVVYTAPARDAVHSGPSPLFVGALSTAASVLGAMGGAAVGYELAVPGYEAKGAVLGAGSGALICSIIMLSALLIP